MEIIVPADPVLLAQAWLRENLEETVSIEKDRPDPVSGDVVLIRRSGGVPSTMVTDAAWLTAEVFSPTKRGASDLAHYVWGVLLAMQGENINGVQCYRVQQINAPIDLPLSDPAESQRPRYTMSVQATFRATSAT